MRRRSRSSLQVTDPVIVREHMLTPDKGHDLDPLRRLAGGVAHEFNNLLTSILGYSELVLRTLPARDRRREDMEEILRAARRGAALTRQLLAVSEEMQSQPELIQLNTVVRRTEPRLQAIVGDAVKIRLELEPKLGRIYVDPTQLELILVNLTMNARDAMPAGGSLTVATANVNVGSDGVEEPRLGPGPYALLCVSDTGTGFSREAIAHLFEPFFTTKELGKGMGLGLATVYGTVRRGRGQIGVNSAPGEGSTVTIYWPSAESGGLTSGADGLD